MKYKKTQTHKDKKQNDRRQRQTEQDRQQHTKRDREKDRKRKSITGTVLHRHRGGETQVHRLHKIIILKALLMAVLSSLAMVIPNRCQNVWQVSLLRGNVVCCVARWSIMWQDALLCAQVVYYVARWSIV